MSGMSEPRGVRLSDAELTRLLRAHLPAGDAALREAIHAHVQSTRQQRSVPGLFGALLDADPRARRRALLLAATLLLALGAAVAGVVGALIDRREPDRIVDLTIKPPADLPAFVRGAYSAMPRLQPMTITTLEDGAIAGRIYVDRLGAVRIERLASRGATVPETYKILAGDTTGELLIVDSRPAWYEQRGAISEDPRVFVYAALGGALSGTGKEYGCEVAISPEEVYSYTPGRAWRHLGLETVAGRPAHHVTCDGRGDLWLDVDTQLTLRSQGVRRDRDGWPIPDSLHTIEVTAIELGQPSPSLFEVRRPDGVRALSEEEYQQEQCLRSGGCVVSNRPLITPPPAPGEGSKTGATELVRLAQEAPPGQGAYAVTFEEMSTGGPDQMARTLQMFDGTNRYRIERTGPVGTAWESTSITLIGDGYYYASETQVDGTTAWNSSSRGGQGGYPLEITTSCHGGWENRGVDLVAGRLADHVGCIGEDVGDFWIDRASHLVLRTQVSDDPSVGTRVREVVDLRFALVPGVEWALPAGAVVRP
jgi:hypothetical protein